MKFNFKKHTYKTTNVKLHTETFEKIQQVATNEKVTFGEAVEALLIPAIGEYNNQLRVTEKPKFNSGAKPKELFKITGSQNFIKTNQDIIELRKNSEGIKKEPEEFFNDIGL